MHVVCHAKIEGVRMVVFDHVTHNDGVWPTGMIKNILVRFLQDCLLGGHGDCLPGGHGDCLLGGMGDCLLGMGQN